LARRVCRQAGELGKDSTTELWRCAEAFGDSGDLTQAETLAAKLDGMGSEDTIEQKVHMPLIRSITERERGNAIRAADLLAPAMQYEQTLDLFYRRAQAYLVAREPAKAAADFNKLLSHRGSGWWQVYAPLAQLGLARASAMQGDHEKTRKAYDDFFTTWKDADPNIPILRQAKAEYKKLTQPHLPPLQCQRKTSSPFSKVLVPDESLAPTMRNQSDICVYESLRSGFALGIVPESRRASGPSPHMS